MKGDALNFKWNLLSQRLWSVIILSTVIVYFMSFVSIVILNPICGSEKPFFSQKSASDNVDFKIFLVPWENSCEKNC